MEPKYPLRAIFDDGVSWSFDDPVDLACNLEWMDTDVEGEVKIVDFENRPVRVLLKACEVIICELEDPASRAP